jgi:hypothetical protein
MVADHQVSQHESRIGRVQQKPLVARRMSGPFKFAMGSIDVNGAHPFRASGGPWYFWRTARHAREWAIMSVGNSR